VLVLVALIWGGSYPAIKATQPFFPPVAFATLRCAVAALVLLAVGLGAGLRAPGLSARDWGRVACAGVLGNAAFHLLMVSGVHRTSPAHAAILVALSPVFAALLARLLLGEALGPRRVAGIAVAFAGVAMIATRAGPAGEATWRGDLLSVAASVAWALYTIIGKPVLARATPRVVTTWATALGALPLLPLGWPGLTQVPWRTLSAAQWLLLLYLSAGTIAVGNLLWYWALARAATARVVSSSYLVPLVAAALSIAVGQETLSATLVVGAAAVIGGVALAQDARRGAPPARAR
jgi:drug/metabolite transporter (DMT)-like permease